MITTEQIKNLRDYIEEVVGSSLQHANGKYTCTHATHPFELPSLNKRDEITTMAYPGYTDPSVGELAKFVMDHAPMWEHILLRRILTAEEHPGHHYVFYEISPQEDHQPSVMVGGCTDFSGGGSTGKYKLDAIFQELSDLFDTKIVEITIPYPASEKLREKLLHEVDRLSQKHF